MWFKFDERRATLYLHIRWLRGWSTWCSGCCSVGRLRRRRNRSGLISNKTARKKNWWVQKQFQILSFQDGVKCTEVNFFMMTKFEDVWKFIFLCRLFYSSSFGASFPVSTKEFLWDFYFNMNLIFLKGFLTFGPDEIAWIRRARGGDVSQVWQEEQANHSPSWSCWGRSTWWSGCYGRRARRISSRSDLGHGGDLNAQGKKWVRQVIDWSVKVERYFLWL